MKDNLRFEDENFVMEDIQENKEDNFWGSGKVTCC